MTSKSINTEITGGYALSTTYSALYIYAAVSGADGSNGATGHAGGAAGVGVVSAHGAYVRNDDIVAGGAGGAGGNGKSSLSVGVAGSTGETGGSGGAGVSLTGGSLVNLQTAVGGGGGVGGAGGNGGSGANGGAGGVGGNGGAGAVLDGASLTNVSTITGGSGGAGGAGGAQGAGGAAGGGGARGQGGDGVDATGGATIVNGSSSDATATIGGYVGVYDLAPGGVTVTNYGTIAGVHASIEFSAYSDTLIAESGSAFIGAVVGGGGALQLAGGAGTISGLGATGTISGAVAMTFSGFGSYQVGAGGAWTLTGANAVAGGAALDIYGSVTNVGVLTGSKYAGDGVVLHNGGLANAAKGTITGYFGLAAYGYSTIANDGTIASTSSGAAGAGVFVDGGAVVNGSAGDAAALITGAVGVSASFDYFLTVTNYGTISGTTAAIEFSGPDNRLIAEAGSTFVGAVIGDGGSLELAGAAGTISGLGSTGTISGADTMTFSGFGYYVVDAGGSWTLAGANTVVASAILFNDGGVVVTGSLVNQNEVYGGATGPSTPGVSLAAGASLTNQADAQIAGYLGVLATAAGVVNFGTIESTSTSRYADGVDMAGGSLTNGALSNHRALIQGSYGVHAGKAVTATIVNYATIHGYGSGAYQSSGVWLGGGGSLRNGAAADKAAVIYGSVFGVYATPGYAATVTNYATIDGSARAIGFYSASDRLIAETGSTCIGQVDGGGGTLEIANGTGTIAGLGGAGMLSGALAMTVNGFGSYVIDAGAAWTLAGANSLGASQSLADNGTVTLAGSLDNNGLIAGVRALTATAASSLTNAGAIDGSYIGVTETGGAIVNLGTIEGDGVLAGGAGVVLSGGRLTNGGAADNTALIDAYVGVRCQTAATTVTNFATLEGAGGVAVAFGSSSDRLIDEAGSTLVGVAQGGGGTLELAAGAGTIAGLASSFTSFGQYVVDAGGTWTLAGANTLTAGTTLTNAGVLDVTGSLLNLGLVIGGLEADNGSVTNGSASATSVSISGADGVDNSNDALTLGNYGTIKGTAGGWKNAGVYIEAGSVTNGTAADASALIAGANGVYAGGQGVTVTNLGQIEGTINLGVRMQKGGALANGSTSDTGALVSGGLDGFYGGDTSTVTNYGTLAGKSAVGAYLYGGSLINGSAVDASAAVIGGKQGIYARCATTVTNFGLIEGPVSVEFKATACRLIDEAGSMLTGVAEGGGGTLELAAGAGTITGLGTAFTGFASYQIDAGGTWTLSGTNALAGGTTLTIANSAVAQVQGALANAGTIALASTGTATDLRVLAAGATLSGGGVVCMSGAKAVITGASAAATLVNDETIEGNGYIGLGELTLDNQAGGAIDATTAGELLVNTASETLVNGGLMQSCLRGALLVLNGATVANAGGTIAGAGGVVDLQNCEVIGGTLAGTRPININTGASTFDGADAGAISLAGAVQVLAGTTLTAEGTLSGAGSVTLFGGGRLVVGVSGLTLSGGGQVDTNSVAADTITGAAAGAALTNSNDHINAAGLLGGGSMALINAAAGLIVGAQSAALTIDTGANTIANAGVIESDGKGGVVIASAVANAGALLAAAGTLALDGLVTGTGVGKINGGVLYATDAAGFEENVVFVNGGTLKLGDSAAYAGTISGFSRTGATALDLADIAFVSGATVATYAGTATGGVLTVTSGSEVAHVHLAGNYLGAAWTLTGDGDGGTRLVDPAVAGPDAAPARMPTHRFAQAMAGAAAASHGATLSGPEPWRSVVQGLAAPRRFTG